MVHTHFLANIVGGWGMLELLVMGLIGLLLFGRRLPEVGRSLGRGIVEFKKGLAGMEDQLLAGPHSEGPATPQQLPAPAAPVVASPPDLAARLEAAEAELRRLEGQLRVRQGQTTPEPLPPGRSSPA